MIIYFYGIVRCANIFELTLQTTRSSKGLPVYAVDYSRWSPVTKSYIDRDVPTFGLKGSEVQIFGGNVTNVPQAKAACQRVNFFPLYY